MWSGTPTELFSKEETISSVDDEKDLDVDNDKNQTWTSHIDCKLSTSYRQLHNNKRNVFFSFLQSVLKIMFFRLVFSLLTFSTFNCGGLELHHYVKLNISTERAFVGPHDCPITELLY